ncbi:peptide ABC transporter ATP-binding protein [Knoellia sinensis KCTC 19936]|uniref:Peptide ABC transporter ATP-binding protein n=1 Tax=Knoellia sinensis KCTC 19936 TaxID=1385520 RepID=A0A0A0JBH5_9MICO|nr:dipeptide ABC transporter ATP-binding protein [Knoellia sinensis]KGN32961.1 peptide ABC transporter ATP-binding protein [Knoellia sinensis KCTC 19936]
MTEPLVQVRGLVKHYPLTRGIVFKKQVGTVRAVDGVDFDLASGETLGLVGESGCGKSTVAKLVLRLEEATEGQVFFEGEDIHDMPHGRLRELRRQIQIVLQDPYSSLNPRMTVGDIVAEPFAVHRSVAPRESWRRRVQDLLERVGLDPDHVNRYPHQFSGGQRQRIGIARALALDPQVLVCDEAVSALDVSVQAQVINLLRQLQSDLGLAYLFIAHDLSVVRHISDRVAVMYLGKIVEVGERSDVFREPGHPYTQALLSAVPSPDPRKAGENDRIVLEGDVPSPADPPSGCHFRTRCWKATERCAAEEPALEVRAAGHPDACHFSEIRHVVR